MFACSRDGRRLHTAGTSSGSASALSPWLRKPEPIPVFPSLCVVILQEVQRLFSFTLHGIDFGSTVRLRDCYLTGLP